MDKLTVSRCRSGAAETSEFSMVLVRAVAPSALLLCGLLVVAGMLGDEPPMTKGGVAGQISSPIAMRRAAVSTSEPSSWIDLPKPSSKLQWHEATAIND